jgi:pimeloyl-ACP methyl ester carboxylesterase
VPLLGELAFKVAQRWMLRLAFFPFISERGPLDGQLLDAFWEPFEHSFSGTLLSLCRGTALQSTDECRWQRALEAFEKPVTFIWGARDPVFRTDRAADTAAMA